MQCPTGVRPALAALALVILMGTGNPPQVLAGVEDWSEEKVNAELVKHVRDVHRIQLTARGGGAAIILGGRIGEAGDDFDVVYHAKVDAAGIQGGDGALAYVPPTSPRSRKLPTVRGTVHFQLRRPMPRSAEEATALFDELMGKGARGGLYGGRPFVEGDDGNWVIYGEYQAEGGEGFRVKAVSSIGPDDDNPRILVISLLSEVDSKRP